MYNIRFQIRFHSCKANLDARLAQTIAVALPVFLMNTFHDILLVYFADCRVCFYQLHLDDEASRE